MAQTLQPVLIATPHFRHGYSLGLRRCYRGSVQLPPRVDENTLVSIVRNLCELSADGELTEQRLKTDVGIILGWIISTQ
jgi:hypothetical protein